MEVEIISKENIKPSSPTPPHLNTFNLSALDQLIISPYVPIILYYPSNNGDNTFQALERSHGLKKSLSETLTQFYPLAGTIKNDLSIDCNDVGANYIVALVHHRLDEFLEHPDHRLINRFLPFEPSFNESSAGNRVTNIQVNIFKCGGIAIGLCISHKILDGAALYTCLKGWANMARGAEEVVYPNLTAPSLFPANGTWLRDTSMVLTQSLLSQGKACTKRFVFKSDAIARLRATAAKNGVQRPTRVEVVSGLIWKCAMAASKEASGVQKPSCLSHFVNLRSKLAATLSNHFIGNLVWISNAAWLASDDNTLHVLVNKVREGISKIDVEFVKKAQGDEGYVAMQNSLKEMAGIGSMGPIAYYGFTSWCKMGFYEIDFGWGKPSWVTGLVGDGMPVFMNLVTLMDTKSGEGIEAWVNLDEPEMEILKKNQELLSYASLDPSPLLNDEAKELTNKFIDHQTPEKIVQLQTGLAFNA
ncbi:hypothetical protein L2E82_36410 [Cichorium intybus]|uniref:Uncharacterized protein n=1 Tax=Cichorium intybus TaxID=13427 RepID=A0ACB9BRJ9_CICIN|nr:hypothetical protein L2E82_36410 [Cichorium intybus]